MDDILTSIEIIIKRDLDFVFDTTTYFLTKRVSEMINEGATIQEVKEKINESGIFSPSRALTIARTTAGTAMSYGQLEAGIEAGATHKVWHDSGFEVREEHQERDGETVAIDKRFSSKFGGPGPMYPGDPDVPIADRINCRCYMSFEFDEN